MKTLARRGGGRQDQAKKVGGSWIHHGAGLHCSDHLVLHL